MWRRANLWFPFTISAGLIVLVAGRLFGFEGVNLVGVALLAGAVASAASTRYFVLARTANSTLLLTGSPIRRVARAVARDDLTAGHIVAAGNTMLATDWSIDGEIYTVPKSCEQDMQAIIA